MRPVVMSNGQLLAVNQGYTYNEFVRGSVTFGEIVFPIADAMDGQVFSIRLNHGGVNTPRRTFEIMLDNTPPKFNLNRIVQQDRYFNDNRSEILLAEGYGVAEKPFSRIIKTVNNNTTIEIGNGNTLRYPFSLGRNFSFNRPDAASAQAPNGIPIFDAFRISYYEVDTRLSNISGERTLDYNDPRFFFDIVKAEGLMSDEDNAFFRIVERDEAGNRSDYFVQLRGKDYVDKIDATGLVKYDERRANEPISRPGDSRLESGRIIGNIISPLSAGAEPVRGYEMSLHKFHDFFARNLFFDLDAGGVSVQRLGLNVMYVDGQRMKNHAGEVVNDATPERFAAAVQRMILAGRGATATDVGDGGAVNFVFNNRFDHAVGNSGGYSWQLRQITRHTPMFGIRQSEQNEVIFGVDDDVLPGGLPGSTSYFFRVFNLTDVKEETAIGNLTQFNTRMATIQNRNHEYLIVATDEFGRTARYAHNGLYGNRLDIKYGGELVEYIRSTPSQDTFRQVGRIDGEIYFGSDVEITFAHTAYDLQLWRDGVKVYDSARGGLLDESLAGHVLITIVEEGNRRETIIVIKPEEGEIIHWEIKAYRILGTGVKQWTYTDGDVPEFWLYGELPVLRFTNQSGADLQDHISDGRKLDDIRPISGIVTMTYSLDGLLFGASVEYTRTWMDANGDMRTTPVAINPLIPRHNFVQEGRFDIIVTNALGFSSNPQRYIFVIDDLTNRHYRVSYDYGGIEEIDEEDVWVEAIEVKEASPSYLYPFSPTLSIPNYFVRNGKNAFLSHLRSIRDIKNEADKTRLIIAPTENSNREVSYLRDSLTRLDTVIYRIYSPVAGTSEYIAITLVPQTSSFLGATLSMVNDPANQLQFESSSSGNLLTVFTKPASLPSQPPLYDANSKISVGLARSFEIGGHEGNQLYVDYYRVNYDDSGSRKEDWERLGTLSGTQKLIIHAGDYGMYTFRVRDQAGNVQVFSGATDLGFEEKDYTTLLNLARAPLYIREGNTTAPIVEGMVYSNSVSLNVIDLPYGLSARENTFATRLQVFHNGVLSAAQSYTVTNKTDADLFRSVNLTVPGNYRVVFSYQVRIGTDEWATDINNREYNFVLVSSTQARQSFSLIPPKNAEISSVRLNGNEIRGRFADTALRQIALSSATGNGIYLITLRLAADNIHQQVRTKSFTVVIGQLPRGVGVRANVGTTQNMSFGFSVSGSTGVSIEVDARILVNTYGDCRIIILREGVDDAIVNLTIGNNRDIMPGTHSEFVSVLPDALKDVGKYSVYIATIDSGVVTLPDGQRIVEGSVFVSQGFRITSSGASPLAVIIIIIVVVLIAVVVFFFIRLRTGMRTK